MKNRIIILSMLGLAAIFAFQSCGKYPGFKKTENGYYVKYHKKNKDGAQFVLEKVATLNIRYHAQIDGKDSILFESKKQNQPFQIMLREPMVKGDIFDALSTLHQGDSVTFMVNAKDFFLKTNQLTELPKGVDSTTWMYFDIGVVKVQTKDELQKEMEELAKVQEAEEGTKLQEYLKKNNISVQPLQSGLIYIETTPGTGAQAIAGKTVKVKYTGQLLDGTIFDSSDKHGGEPYPFTLGKGQVIPGWDEGIALMKKGGKAKLIIPSKLAYGGRNAGQIPAFSTLIFDVELVDVQ